MSSSPGAAPPESPYNVFLSWSGDRSRALATALYDWLPMVVQAVVPWMSDRDIASGQRWREQLGRQLGSLRIGVVCLFPETLKAPSIHFEAGVIAGRIDDDKRILPYYVGSQPTDVSWPLSDFQVVLADRDGTVKLLESINTALGTPLKPSVLLGCFENSWGTLKKRIDGLKATPADGGAPKTRSDSEMLVEVLERVRSIERDVAGPWSSGIKVTGKMVPAGAAAFNVTALGTVGDAPLTNQERDTAASYANRVELAFKTNQVMGGELTFALPPGERPAVAEEVAQRLVAAGLKVARDGTSITAVRP